MREMRLKNRERDRTFAMQVVDTCLFGTLALIGEDGVPYAVPVSPAALDEKIYFHCATDGYKLDCIRKNPSVSINFVDEAVVDSKKFTTYYKSCTVFGKAEVVRDRETKRCALMAICQKYSPAEVETYTQFDDKTIDALCIVSITIREIRGKENTR